MKGKNIKSEDKRTPANVQMRLKLFPYFLKSRESCNQFPACIQVSSWWVITLSVGNELFQF